MKLFLLIGILLNFYASTAFAEARISEGCKNLSRQMKWHRGDTVFWENRVLPDFAQAVQDSRTHATRNLTFKSALSSYGYSLDKINQRNNTRLQQECNLNQINSSGACHHYKAYCLNDITTKTLFSSFDSFNDCALNRHSWCGESFQTPEGIVGNLEALTRVYNEVTQIQDLILENPSLNEYFGDIQQAFDNLQAKLAQANKASQDALAKLDQEIKADHKRLLAEDARYNNACSIMDQCEDYIDQKGYDDEFQLLNQTRFCSLDQDYTSDELKPLTNLLAGINEYSGKQELKSLAINSLNNSIQQTVTEFASLFKAIHGRKPNRRDMCQNLEDFCQNNLAIATLANLDVGHVQRINISQEIDRYNDSTQAINQLCSQASSVGVDDALAQKLQAELTSIMYETRMGQLMGIKHFRDKVPPFDQAKCFEDGEGFTPIENNKNGIDLVRSGLDGILDLQKDKSEQLIDMKNQVTYAGKWTNANDDDYFEILQDVLRNDPLMVKKTIKNTGNPKQALWLCKATHDIYRTKKINNRWAGVGTGLAIAGAVVATIFSGGLAAPVLIGVLAGSMTIGAGVGIYKLDQASTARHNAAKSMAIQSAEMDLMLAQLPNLDNQVKMAYVEIGMSVLPGVIKGVGVAGKTVGGILRGSKVMQTVPSLSRLSGASRTLVQTIQKGGKVTEEMLQKALASKLPNAHPAKIAEFTQLLRHTTPDVAIEMTVLATTIPDPPGPFSEEGMLMLSQAVVTSIGFNKLGASGRRWVLNRQNKKTQSQIANINRNRNTRQSHAPARQAASAPAPVASSQYALKDPEIIRLKSDYKNHLNNNKSYQAEIPRRNNFSPEASKQLNQLEGELKEVANMGPVQRERVQAAMNSLTYSVDAVDETTYINKVTKKLNNLRNQNTAIIKVTADKPRIPKTKINPDKYKKMSDLENDFDLLTRKSSAPADGSTLHEVDVALMGEGIPKHTLKTGESGQLIVDKPYNGEKVFAVGHEGALAFGGQNSNVGGERYYGLVYEKGFIQKYGADITVRQNAKHGSTNTPSAKQFNQHYGEDGSVFVIRSEKATQQQGQVHVQLSGGYTQMEINGSMTSQADWMNQYVRGVVEFDQSGNIIRFIPRD